MRFSNALPARSTPLPLVGQTLAGDVPVQERLAPVAPVAAATSPEPPDDLDWRVRMVGEWQVGDW